MLGALFGPAAYAGGEHFGALHITRFGLVSRILKVDPWICRARRIARDACVCVCVCARCVWDSCFARFGLFAISMEWAISFPFMVYVADKVVTNKDQ